MNLLLGRRALLGGMGALAGAGLADTALATTSPPIAPMTDPAFAPHCHKIETRFVEFADPVERFEAHFRIERDLVPEQGTTITWYYWLVFMVPETQHPVPILRNQGTEYSYFRKVAKNTYRIHAHDLSLPMSLQTNDFCTSIVNPVTGETVKTPPSLLLDDPGTVQSPKGFRNLAGDGTYMEPYQQFRVQNGMMKLDSVRTAPPSWPANFIETSIQEIPYEMFLDKSITNLLSTSKGVYVFPYPKWLKMGDRPGHMLGFWDSVKIPSVEDYPAKFLARMKADYPELLKPRWQAFDKPAPFAY